MTILEIFRNKAFWFIDTMKGGHIKKAYSVIEKCDRGIWSEVEIEEYQKAAIAKLLLHTKNTVNAYKNQESLDILHWPVVSKVDLKTNLDGHISSDYNKDNLIVMSTSGSTGTPFRSYQDLFKKYHVNAEVLYYNGLVDFKIGRRILYFRSIVNEVAKSKMAQFAQNILLLDCQGLNDNYIKEKLIEIRKASKKSGCMILSYASTLDAFRKYFQKYGYDEAKNCNVYGIVSGSEMLNDVTRESLEKAFGCKVVSRYANEENGFLGQDDIDNNIFIPNRANYFYEILKLTEDKPVSDGEVGRIVITDLYNYAMPFVRYDTGDIGAWVETEHFGKRIKAIGNFGGRIVDMIFDTKGNQISPFSITNKMWEFQGIKQFQFIQKGKTEYLLKLNLERKTFEDLDKLKVLFLDLLGHDAKIAIEYCDEIPVLASGKRRYLVNEMFLKK